MKIIFKRTQYRSWLLRRVRFRLWCELELEQTEKEAIRHYDLAPAILASIEVPNLMRYALVAAAVTAPVSFFLFAYFFGRVTGGFLACGSALAAGWFVYDYFRETIYVKDLVHGRDFRCGTVSWLAWQEDELKKLVAILKRVIETSKYWDGGDVIEVPPYDEDFARDVIVTRYA